ncbi:MAG: hypothetical protein U5R14_05815 [Gemmatimonadota bacterium]|nr:hypothetical protein [Gemmatimonadota bacterium]
MGLDFLVPIFGILLVLVPVTGLTAILTLRYGGKPFVETLARELRGSGALPEPQAQRRIEELAEQVEQLTGEVERLREAQSFDDRLLGTESAERPPSSRSR